MLEKWSANCNFGNIFLKQGQVKPETVSSCLSALKSYHIDRQISFKDFNNLRMALIIKEDKKLFFNKKQNRLSITKNILTKINKDKPITIHNFNIDTTFKIAWASFIKLGKITYMATKPKKIFFKNIKITRSDILFANRD